MNYSQSTKLVRSIWWSPSSVRPRVGVQTKLAVAAGLVAIIVAGLVGLYGLHSVHPVASGGGSPSLLEWAPQSATTFADNGEGVWRSLALSSLAAFLLSVALGALIGRHISAPIRIIDRCLQRVADGDLQPAAKVRRRDELGDLAQRFNHMVERLRENRERLLREANTDVLTSLHNRRYAQETLARETERSLRYNHIVGAAIVDIDNFKLFNDSYGRVEGDQVLKAVAKTLAGIVRTSDVIARYDGDAFLLILPETDADGVAGIARRIQAEMCRFTYSTGAGQRIPVTCSVGSALFPSRSGTQSELLGLAESAVDAARKAGGNTHRSANATPKGESGDPSVRCTVLEGLVEAVDGKDHYTRHHSDMVARLSVAAADRLCLPEEVRDTVRIASLLHDVGKLGIPNGILRKPGPLTDVEYKVMKEHPSLGAKIVQELPQLPQVLAAIKHHHERYDGTGYPDGLKESEIPLISRIMAVADAYSAMTSDRPYRKSLGHGTAIEELKRSAGQQFDPDIVALFMDILNSNEAVGLAAIA